MSRLPVPFLGRPGEVNLDVGRLSTPSAGVSDWRRSPGRDSAFISDAPLRASGPLDRADPCAAAHGWSAAGGPHARRAPGSLSLHQYAALCAETSAGTPSPELDQALLRHGIADREAWQTIDRGWQDQLARDPILTLRWMELTARYREQLKRR